MITHQEYEKTLSASPYAMAMLVNIIFLKSKIIGPNDQSQPKL